MMQPQFLSIDLDLLRKEVRSNWDANSEFAAVQGCVVRRLFPCPCVWEESPRDGGYGPPLVEEDSVVSRVLFTSTGISCEAGQMAVCHNSEGGNAYFVPCPRGCLMQYSTLVPPTPTAMLACHSLLLARTILSCPPINSNHLDNGSSDCPTFS